MKLWTPIYRFLCPNQEEYRYNVLPMVTRNSPDLFAEFVAKSQDDIAIDYIGLLESNRNKASTWSNMGPAFYNAKAGRIRIAYFTHIGRCTHYAFFTVSITQSSTWSNMGPAFNNAKAKSNQQTTTTTRKLAHHQNFQ
eukprot:GHVP01002108.1.p1 GENE.GHVP01002108.1~~GHVP01002108.1.p1  ORF type:complete len:138 (+),score=7.27 GHVP01002108.1:204-617(+)